ncbi:MAG: DNA-processing protein DprA [Patescibacteria group bacterium]
MKNTLNYSKVVQLANMKLSAISKNEFPAAFSPLLEIPEPPEKLYYRGALPDDDTVLLAVVGSRKYSHYGKEACEQVVKGLRGYDITIVSGLALGIDSIAHRSALDAGLKTIAVPGSGLDDDALYPREHLQLAREIVEKGGALVSEYEPDFKATTWSFPRRNRIMAGLSKAVLVVEAERPSGTLITARLALDYGRDVFAVPGSIFSETSRGAHFLIRQGATPITSSLDILTELGFKQEEFIEKIRENEIKDALPVERQVLLTLTEPRTRQELKELIGIPIEQMNMTLSVLEIKGLIIETGGKIMRC